MILAIVLLYFIIAFTFLIGFYYSSFYTEEGRALVFEEVRNKVSSFDDETIERFIKSNVCKRVIFKEFCKLCLLWPKLITGAIKRRKSRKK